MNLKSECINILGVGVSAIKLDDAIAAVEGWIEKRKPHYVCITGVHGVMESRKDPRLRDIHNQADLVAPDGMPLVWISRWLGATQVERVYGPDLMRAITARSPARGYRHFYYGGAPGVASQLAAALTAANNGLNVVGTLCPPFRPLTPEEDDEVVAQINAAAPDIVWVGLSTPKQEYWMASHIGLIKAPVMIGVGAAFDFLAGTKKQAPTWMQQHGLEWLYRLCMEPRRLWRRYAYIVPGFLFLAAGEFARHGLRLSKTASSR
jgi:N-acetylglucosaminyldiphosphoundecaprenol N-acetyl-beta-D-mannosaminyltransferase